MVSSLFCFAWCCCFLLCSCQLASVEVDGGNNLLFIVNDGGSRIGMKLRNDPFLNFFTLAAFECTSNVVLIMRSPLLFSFLTLFVKYILNKSLLKKQRI